MILYIYHLPYKQDIIISGDSRRHNDDVIVVWYLKPFDLVSNPFQLLPNHFCFVPYTWPRM